MAYRVGCISLGCEKNRVDAEMMMASLEREGFQLVDDVAMGNAAIVNTCGFIESAKQESIEEILELAKLKEEGRIKAIVVTGCLAERYQQEIAKELPEVNAVVGIGANKEIARIVREALEGKRIETFPPKCELPLEGERVQSTPSYFSYLKIAEGCDNHCTYCAIPLIRGGYRSRKMEDILAEAEKLAQWGVKELMVIAQDTTRYGEDLYGEGKLPQLLTELCKVEGICWIRVLYCYPERITDELLEVMAKEDKILKYMDLPLQHCNRQVLRAMNRQGDRESLSALIRKIREKVPGIVLRTTFMVGFPGETEEAFEELAEFAKEMRFERMGCFAYSQEEGTPAARLPDQISREIKEHRQELMMEQQMALMDEMSREMVGKTITVLNEGWDRYAECCFGRSAADAPEIDTKVFFTVEGKKPYPGMFVQVEITDTMDCDLIGQVVTT